MSTSRDSCCLPSVKKQKHDFPYLDLDYSGYILDYSGYHKNLIQYLFNINYNIARVRFSCVCPVIDNEFRHNIVKVAADQLGYPQLL